jgi:hypothetical protein
MSRRSKIWLVVAGLFSLGNFVGGVMAGAAGEVPHAGAHALLALLGAYAVWLLLAPWRGARFWGRVESVSIPLPLELANYLKNLEQSVDAIAIEVERIGEGQRYLTRLFTEKGIAEARGEAAPEPIEIKARDSAPPVRRD